MLKEEMRKSSGMRSLRIKKAFFLYVNLDGERRLLVSISANSTVMDLKRVIGGERRNHSWLAETKL